MAIRMSFQRFPKAFFICLTSPLEFGSYHCQVPYVYLAIQVDVAKGECLSGATSRDRVSQVAGHDPEVLSIHLQVQVDIARAGDQQAAFNGLVNLCEASQGETRPDDDGGSQAAEKEDGCPGPSNRLRKKGKALSRSVWSLNCLGGIRHVIVQFE